MTTAWAATFLALALITAVLATLTLGLLRRVLELLIRVESTLTPALPKEFGGSGLEVGAAAPPLPSAAAKGTGEGAVVVFLEVGCEPCRVLADDVARRRFSPRPLSAYAVVDDAIALGVRLPSEWSVIVDRDHHIASAWRVNGTPIAFVVTEQRRVGARGYVNTVRDLKQLMKKRDEVYESQRFGQAQDNHSHLTEMSHHER